MTHSPNSSSNSLSSIATRQLNLKNQKLPDKIRYALHTIFTKSAKGTDFQSQVINSEKVVNHSKHLVKPDKTNAIYNALILILLYQTKSIREIFQKQYQLHHLNSSSDIKSIKPEITDYLKLHSLGIEISYIEQIQKQVHSKEFNIFVQKLPTPFKYANSKTNDLSFIATIFADNTPWNEYEKYFQQASLYFQQRKLFEAKQQLAYIDENTRKNIPKIALLNDFICREIEEVQEALALLKKISN